MAWSNPTTRSPGYTVPSTEWNKNTVDNPAALRAGEIAIASQAEGDVITASSATQLARVAPGVAGTVLASNGAGVAPSFQALEAAATFTPTWTGSGSNPSIGNGTLAGRYVRHGSRVWCEVRLVAGGTTTFGTGTYSFALPVAAAATSRGVGSAVCIDAGTATYVGSVWADSSASAARVVLMTTGGAVYLAHNSPFTMANGDELSFGFTYEAA